MMSDLSFIKLFQVLSKAFPFQYSSRFPRESKKKQSNNDDKHGHGHEEKDTLNIPNNVRAHDPKRKSKTSKLK